MKLFGPAALIFGFCDLIAHAQWQEQTIGSKADFRGLCVVSVNVAWVSGTLVFSLRRVVSAFLTSLRRRWRAEGWGVGPEGCDRRPAFFGFVRIRTFTSNRVLGLMEVLDQLDVTAEPVPQCTENPALVRRNGEAWNAR